MAKRSESFDADPRRLMAIGLSVVMLLGSTLTYLFASGNSANFAMAAMGRIGLVMGALAIAWPSLKRPAKWLPAGAAMIGVIALLVIAVRPRLVIVALPAAGLLITVSAFARAMRKRD